MRDLFRERRQRRHPSPPQAYWPVSPARTQSLLFVFLFIYAKKYSTRGKKREDKSTPALLMIVAGPWRRR